MNGNATPCEDVEHLSEVLKLLGVPSRLRILCSLGMECRPVSDIIAATGLSQTNVSFHLRLLREAGLVRPERRGPFIYYCLPDPGLLTVLEELRHRLADPGAASPEGDGDKPCTMKFPR